MRNIIHIDLRDFSFDDLKEFCTEYGLNYNPMYGNKKKGITNLWFDNDTKEVIASENIRVPNSINYTINIEEYLKSITQEVEIVDEKEEIVYDVDVILEKINQFGMDSLKKSELDFLKNR